MPGSPGDPVKLDMFQAIVNVHWKNDEDPGTPVMPGFWTGSYVVDNSGDTVQSQNFGESNGPPTWYNSTGLPPPNDVPPYDVVTVPSGQGQYTGQNATSCVMVVKQNGASIFTRSPAATGSAGTAELFPLSHMEITVNSGDVFSLHYTVDFSLPPGNSFACLGISGFGLEFIL
jgi:hypothetical protein